MKSFLSSLLTAVTMVLVTAGLSFGQTVPVTIWPLESSTADSVTSNVTAEVEAVTGLQSAYEVPAAGTTLNVQKLKPDSATSDQTNGTGSWPVDSALNAGRYVQFAITPQTNYSVTLDSISLMIGAKGIKGMNASVFYSMHSDFSDSTQISEMDSLVENAVKDTTLSASISVSSGETVYVRVFPWTGTSSTSTSKYLFIGTVVVYGSVWTTPMASDGKWDFQSDSLADSTSHIGWGPYDLNASIVDDPLNPGKGNHVLECVVHNYNAAPVLMAVLPAGKTLADYKSFDFAGYFAQGDVGYKNIVVEAYQTMPTAQAYNNSAVQIGSYNRAEGAATSWQNFSIPINGSFSIRDTVYFAFGINCSGSSGGKTTIWYADDIQLVQQTTTASSITQWGIAYRNNPGWHLTVSGDTATFGGGLVEPWAGIRGAFKHPLVASTATDGAVVVSGKVTFVGGGPIGWSGIRYGIFNNLVPGTLDTSVPDSAYWKGFAESSYGYMFTPQDGTSYAGNIPGGTAASQGITLGGSWISTYGGAVGFGGLIQQAPARATMTAGTYSFAFSVHPLSNGTKRVNFYLYKDTSPVTYYYAGSLIDTTSQTHSDTLNAVCFGAEVNGTTATMTGMTFFNVVDSLGPDITIPKAPWEDYYAQDWGFYGGRTGGWHLTPLAPGNLEGNATVSGDTAIPEQQWVAVRAGFVGNVAPYNGTDSTLTITGNLDFGGGSFQYPHSFEFGLFNNPNPGSLDSTVAHGYMWTGSENGSGYLFIPPSGDAGSSNWVGATHQQGTFGGVLSRPWLSTNGDSNYVLGTTLQSPRGAVPDTGMYDFWISVAPGSNGTQTVSAALYNSDKSYAWESMATDKHTPLAATSFNSVEFALEGGNPTTSLAIENLHVTMAKTPAFPVALAVKSSDSNVPKTFALYQNYPNPFNPSTTILYDIPKTSHVKIVIYDVLGRAVTTLVDRVQSASSYRLNWNAQRYSSGVYFLHVEAQAQDGSGSFASVKKLMFVK